MNSNENEQKNLMDSIGNIINNNLAIDPQVTASNVGTKIDNIMRQAEYNFHQARIDVPDEILKACNQRGYYSDNDISKKNLDDVFLHHSRKPTVNPVLLQDYPNIMNTDNTTFNNRQL